MKLIVLSPLLASLAAPFASAQTPAPTICVPEEINLCIALDHSGSVCSHTLTPSELGGGAPGGQQCLNCPDFCQDSCRNGSYSIFDTCPDEGTTGFDKSTCCSLFNQVKNLAKGVVDEVVKDGRAAEFSIVGFGTNAFFGKADGSQEDLVSYSGPMMNPTDAAAAVLNKDYTGGTTNHASAIEYCQASFDYASDKTRRNVILLITDGVATRPCSAGYTEGDPNAGCPNNVYAQNAALAEKAAAAGTYVRPMFYNPYATQSQKNYINSLGDDDLIEIDPDNTQAAIEEAVYTEGFICGPTGK